MPRKITGIISRTYDLASSMSINKKTYNKQGYLNTWFKMAEDISSSGDLVDSIRGVGLTPSNDAGFRRPSYTTSIIPDKLDGVTALSLNSSYIFPIGAGSEVVLEQKSSVVDEFAYGHNSPSPNNAFTFGFWIRFSNTNVDRTILSKWHDSNTSQQQYQIRINGGQRRIQFRVYHNPSSKIYQIQSSAQLVADRWYHIAFAFSGNASEADSLKIYIDGKLDKSDRLRDSGSNSYPDGSIFNKASSFAIGNDYVNIDGAKALQGILSELAIWTTELGEDDLYVIYNMLSLDDSSKFRSGYVNLPPRIEIRNRDNATGSYPTILRMGDKDRRGSYSTQFDDTNTIFFGRRIRDNFELKDEDKVDGILGVSKNINSKLWEWSKGLEIRRELFRTAGANSTSRDGALVFVGPPRGASGRFLRTKNKIKNATLQAEVIFGPYNESRTVLGYGLGLKSPGGLEDRGLKIQVSTTGAVGTWITIKTLTGNADSLFLLSTADSREEFETLLRKRKRVKIKLSPTDFASVGSSEFYLRFAQTSVINRKRAEWAIGYVNIEYHNEDVRYPIMVDPTSRVGQRVISGAVATPHTLPTITAPGRSISGISDVHLKFTPGEGISAFDESRINIKSEDFFFQQGSDPDVISGMSAPLWSKTQFVIDLSPDEETTFGMTTPGTVLTSSNETDPDIKQQLMVYWNNDLKRWEKIAQGISGNPASDNLKNMITSGALGFSGIDMVSTGSSRDFENQSIVSANALNSYARPTSTFGFPFEGKYHATASQYTTARDLGITKPFILEKCQISFDSKFEFGEEGYAEDAYSLLYGYADGSSRTVDSRQRVYIPTFFMLRQQNYDNFSVPLKYNTDYAGYLTESIRQVSVPNSLVRLSTSNTVRSYVPTSRELLTYGQITLFVSSSVGNPKFEIREVLDKGLSRDAEVDILQVNGQNGELLSNEDVNAITGSFVINFPSRMTGKINGGSRARVKNTAGNLIGLWLNNKLGGRAYGNLDSSARSIINGTPVLEKAGSYKTFSTNTGYEALNISIATAENTDLYSPYVIMPEDKIIFGWQYPMTNMVYDRSPANNATKFHSMTLFQNSKLTLFGSQLQEGKEFHETVNQNLGASAVHEIIGGEPVVDEFINSRAIENVGSYLDNYVATTANNPVDRVGALVQSRLTTEKGDSSKGQAQIKFPQLTVYPFANNPGMNDGDRISIKDAAGTIVHFYGHRIAKKSPQNVNGITATATDTNNNQQTDNTSPGSTIWGSDTVYDLLTNSVYGHRWSSPPSASDSVIYPADGLVVKGYANVKTHDAIPAQVFSFKIVGGDFTGASMSGNDQADTLTNLLTAINLSSLRVEGEVVAPLIGAPRLNLTLMDAGSANQFEVIYTSANSLINFPSDPNEMQDSYTVPEVTGFADGNDLLDSSLGSFTRVIPTGDGNRVYSDSLIRRANIGFSNSSYGTMQTLGRGIRPKYYLDGKKYGQSIHFLEQAKDSKTKFSLKTKKFGLLDTVKVGALQSPVSITFVSGTNSSSTGFRTFSKKSPTDAVNKTVNSVLTGAFYDPA